MPFESNELSARFSVAIVLFYFYIVCFSLTPSIMNPIGTVRTVVRFFLRAHKPTSSRLQRKLKRQAFTEVILTRRPCSRLPDCEVQASDAPRNPSAAYSASMRSSSCAVGFRRYSWPRAVGAGAQKRFELSDTVDSETRQYSTAPSEPTPSASWRRAAAILASVDTPGLPRASLEKVSHEK
jgi:hypothetical protein